MKELVIILFAFIATYELCNGVCFVSMYLVIQAYAKANPGTGDLQVVLPKGYVPRHYFEKLTYNADCFLEKEYIAMPFLGQLVCTGVLSTATLTMLSREVEGSLFGIPLVGFMISIVLFYAAKHLVTKHKIRRITVEM